MFLESELFKLAAMVQNMVKSRTFRSLFHPDDSSRHISSDDQNFFRRYIETFGLSFFDQCTLVLLRGLSEWGGPPNPCDSLAPAMGFLGTNDFHAERMRILAVLADGGSLSTVDRRQPLVATEIVFVRYRAKISVSQVLTQNCGQGLSSVCDEPSKVRVR